MPLRTGVDLLEISRLEAAISRHGERFLARVFTSAERTLFNGNLASLAARFAAKEAVAKALGTGIGDVSWQEIEILRGANSQPTLHLHGNAKALAEQLNLSTWAISLTHTDSLALAFVTATNH